ncbi:hypothetical protein EVJ58_g7453 [Rhodofomes roseus]|uniref:Uncharacterized protein n=1 Tax=Rhodofomes roseus TaxID=34475 RepID=A0A4Y9Y2Q2_9APHY|nr:hypothetical protein EVJ58_g7453 [Rhodofomes roseus]
MGSAIERFWDALLKHVNGTTPCQSLGVHAHRSLLPSLSFPSGFHSAVYPVSPPHFHSITDDAYDWGRFEMPLQLINNARAIVQAGGIEALENLIDDDYRPYPLAASNTGLIQPNIVHDVPDDDQSVSACASGSAVSLAFNAYPVDVCIDIPHELEACRYFVSARSLLAAPSPPVIKLTVSQMRFAYPFGDGSTYWLYGRRLPEIETVVRVVEWCYTPNGLQAVVEDRYDRQMPATWCDASYPTLSTPLQRNDIVRFRGNLELVTRHSIYYTGADDRLEPYNIFVINYAWLEGVPPDPDSGVPQMFVHEMRSKRQFKAHLQLSRRTRLEDVKSFLVPTMDALNALVQAGNYGAFDDTPSVPTLAILTPVHICSDELYRAFNRRRQRAPGTPITLQDILRDAARIILLYDWQDLEFVVGKALSVLVREKILKEAVTADGVRVYL